MWPQYRWEEEGGFTLRGIAVGPAGDRPVPTEALQAAGSGHAHWRDGARGRPPTAGSRLAVGGRRSALRPEAARGGRKGARRRRAGGRAGGPPITRSVLGRRRAGRRGKEERSAANGRRGACAVLGRRWRAGRTEKCPGAEEERRCRRRQHASTGPLFLHSLSYPRPVPVLACRGLMALTHRPPVRPGPARKRLWGEESGAGPQSLGVGVVFVASPRRPGKRLGCCCWWWPCRRCAAPARGWQPHGEPFPSAAGGVRRRCLSWGELRPWRASLLVLLFFPAFSVVWGDFGALHRLDFP